MDSPKSGHIALLGDSIFDNGAYTSGGPDVVTQVRRLLPTGWEASLLAVDGAVIDDIPSQLSRLPAEATHLILSIGGNDVLANLDMMSETVATTTQSLGRIHQRVVGFERSYRRALSQVIEYGVSTTICTIYNGNLSQQDAALLGLATADVRVLSVGLAPFNDVILRMAFENRLDVIDLRLVCTEPEDYANPIEPSSRGAEKIAAAIARALGFRDSKAASRVIW